jgi:hypothetical protein
MSSPSMITRPEVGWKNARDHVEKRGLARAVGADQPGDGARLDGQRGTVDGMKAAEMLVHMSSTTIFGFSLMSPGTLGVKGRARARRGASGLTVEVKRSTVLDRFDLAILDHELAVVAGAFTGADELNGRCAHIVDVATVLEDLERLASSPG